MLHGDEKSALRVVSSQNVFSSDVVFYEQMCNSVCRVNEMLSLTSESTKDRTLCCSFNSKSDGVPVSSVCPVKQ